MPMKSSDISNQAPLPQDLARTRTKSFEALLADVRRIIDDGLRKAYLLCAETSKDIARYSILNDSKQLYAAKYLTYMPTEEELRREIERQKEIYRLQEKDK